MALLRRLLFPLMLVITLAFAALPLVADEGEPAETAESAAEEKPAPPTLHKIYVPFRDLSKVFEKEGEGVFLPYEEFLDLWRRAHDVGIDDKGPPVKAALRTATYEGEADGDMVRLDAKFEIEVLASGWQRIPLDFAGAGIEKAMLDGEPALLLPAATGYELLLEDEGRRTLDLSLRIAAARDGDLHTAEFSLPPVPLSRLTLCVPGCATEVEVAPRRASTTRPISDGRTELVAFLGPVQSICITWRQKVDEGPRVEPLVFADECHDVRADRGVLRNEFTADLTILRAPLERLTLAVPADAITLYMQGDGIRTWTRSADGTQIDVELREGVRERWRLSLGLERPLPELPADVVLPLAAVEGVERETGFVRLLMGEGVTLEPRATPGLLQVDVSELPDPLKGAPPGRALAYRFPARPGAATVAVAALEPRLTASSGTRVVIRPEGTDVCYNATIVVERAGIFGVTLDVSEDLEVTAVRVAGVPYDDHEVRTEEDGSRVLAIEFRDRLLGRASIFVDGRTPTPLPAEDGDDDDGEVALAVPLLVLEGVDHMNGYLAVQLDGAIEHRVTEKQGLVVLDAGAPAALEPSQVQGATAPLAYRFEYHEGAIGLTLGLKRRDPAVTARVEMWARLEPDRTRIGVTLGYDVRYRGIDTMRFTAPLDVGTRMHLDVEGMQLLGPEPIDGGEETDGGERGLWTVKLPSPRTGVIPIPLELDDVPEEPLASGDSRSVVLPTFVPLEEDGTPLPNTVHNVAVRRDPLLEATPETIENAEEIDARELPPTLRSEDNFLAFRSYDPALSIRIHVTRHDFEPVAEVVVSHMHLDTVLPREGRATTEAYLVVRNNDRQYLDLVLPGNATIRAVTVGGKVRSPREGEKGTVLIPLPSGLGKDEAFVVALAYDHDVERSSSLGFDTVRVESPLPLRVTADLLTWRVFGPQDRTFTCFGGDLEPADPHRSWFASLVEGLSQVLGRRAEGADVAVARVAGGFESPFATRHEGEEFLFSNRIGVGFVEITSVDPSAFVFEMLLFFALLLGATLLLARIAGRIGLGEGTLVAALILVLLVLLVRASPGMAQVLNAMLCGVLVAGAIRLGVFWNRERCVRVAAKADEPSEGAPAGEGGAS